MVRFQILEDDFNNSSCPHSIAMRNPKFPYVESAFLSIIVNSVSLTTYHHISSGFILFFHFNQTMMKCAALIPTIMNPPYHPIFQLFKECDNSNTNVL